MPKPTEYDKTHRRNMAAIGTRIDRIFKKAAEEAAKIGVSIKTPLPDDRIFSFDDYPQTQKQIERLMAALQESMEVAITSGVRSGWTLANNKNNALCDRVFGDNVGNLTKEQYRRYYSNNDDALQAFLQRKTKGLNLSDRVWRYTEGFKTEIELGLDLGIRSGCPAAKMARDLKQYLVHPDKLFRRVRDQHGILRLSQAAKDFHPGQGVYRSSYKNARRLAVTETNMAYHTADHLRWQQLDFVVGIEIKVSGNHTIENNRGQAIHFYDICDTLAGKYPKDFKFVGWHPHCRCQAISILKTEEELAEDTQRILDGKKPTKGSVNAVETLPDAFKGWVEQHAGRIEMGGNLPYFVSDNRKMVDKVLGISTEPEKTMLERAAERHANRKPDEIEQIQARWNEHRIESLRQSIADGYLPKEVQDVLDELRTLNTPEHFEELQKRIEFYQSRAKKHMERTPKEIQDIKDAWKQRADRAKLVANNVLKVAQDYAEVDYSRLQALIAKGDAGAMRIEAQKVAQAIKSMRDRENALSDLIPDVHGWHKMYSMSELLEAHNKIEATLQYWKAKGYDLSIDSSLSTLKAELEQKIQFVENPGHFKKGLVAHKTWQVQQDAYLKLLDKVEIRIETIKLEAEYNALLTFDTKSKDFKEFMAKAKAALDAGDTATAKHFLSSADWKKTSLEARRKGTSKIKGSKTLDSLYSGGCPFTPAEITKIKDYEDQILQSVTKYGSVSDTLNKEYHEYILKLSEKYYSKQKSLYTATEQAAMKKAADTYLARPSINPHYVWGTDVGGVYKGRYQKRLAYLKKLGNGITADELSIVQRFTNGSTFSNAYNLRHSSPYWAKKWRDKMAMLTPAQAKEMEQIIEEWSQGANYTLDRMVRYNGVTFRGLDSGGGAELRAQLEKAFKSGTAWVNEASCSTSMKFSVAESFDGDIIMVIHNKTGAYIHAMSDYSTEYEIMTLRGARYRVIKPPTFIGGRWIAELEEI